MLITIRLVISMVQACTHLHRCQAIHRGHSRHSSTLAGLGSATAHMYLHQLAAILSMLSNSRGTTSGRLGPEEAQVTGGTMPCPAMIRDTRGLSFLRSLLDHHQRPRTWMASCPSQQGGRQGKPCPLHHRIRHHPHNSRTPIQTRQHHLWYISRGAWRFAGSGFNSELTICYSKCYASKSLSLTLNALGG